MLPFFLVFTINSVQLVACEKDKNLLSFDSLLELLLD